MKEKLDYTKAMLDYNLVTEGHSWTTLGCMKEKLDYTKAMLDYSRVTLGCMKEYLDNA